MFNDYISRGYGLDYLSGIKKGSFSYVFRELFKWVSCKGVYMVYEGYFFGCIIKVNFGSYLC